MSETNKYIDAIQQYNTDWVEDDVKKEIDSILSKNYKDNDNTTVYKKLHSFIDYTSLNTIDTKESIWKLTEQINDFDGKYSDIDNIAAICVFPNFVEIVKESLTDQNVKIACVAGGFPSSQTFTEVKIAEVALAVANGAEEIDTVLNLGYFFEENYQELSEEIDEIKHTGRGAKLKVILETGALQNLQNIAKASILAIYAGADFVKTSTGKVYDGATLEATYVISNILKDYYSKTNTKIGFKISGGISTIEIAIQHYTIVKEILGNDWLTNDLFRIGSSKLRDKILELI